MVKKQQGIQSVEAGMRVLKALASTAQDLSLKSVSAATGMSASTAHRYLVSLGRAGLVEQDPVTGRYGLGAEALEIGLAALGRIDPIKIGTAAQAELHKRVDVNSLLAIWGTHGPTVIRWKEASQPVTVNVRVGSAMPLLTSSTGRGFMVWRRNDALATKLIKMEVALRKESGLPAIDIEKIQAETLRHGMARVDGDLVMGISGLSVPIVAHDGNAVLILTAFGLRSIFDASWNGPIATALKEVAAVANRRLGPPVFK
jgi:DNA-binding IclR family transcriptional regulator